MIQLMLEIWSLVPLPFLNQSCTSESSQFTYCWSLVWSILSITLLACEMSAIVQYFEHSLPLPFFGIGMKTDLFQSCVATIKLSKWIILWSNNLVFEWVDSKIQGIFPTQGLNLGLHCRWILYYLTHQGSPFYFSNTIIPCYIYKLYVRMLLSLCYCCETFCFYIYLKYIIWLLH